MTTLFKYYLALLLIGLGANAMAQTTAPVALHAAWDSLLQRHVNRNGLVNYAKFQKDTLRLNAYLQRLQANPPNRTNHKESVAYWINAYNAFTIQLVLQHYGYIQSIRDLDNGKVWTTRTLRIAGKDYTLDAIEKEILIKQYHEPRIHFAINCAARSCPPLLNKAWTAQNLDIMLVEQTRAFINNQQFNDIQPLACQLSPIFEWYGADFGNLIQFINQYGKVKVSPIALISFKTYDWRLNKQ